MPVVDLAFRLLGNRLPVDHGYDLYGAVSRQAPAIHEAKEVGILPVRGRYAGDGTLHLTSNSRLTLRLPDGQIRNFLKLAGKDIDVRGHRLRIGVPETRPLRPTESLYARLVTIKGFLEPEPFLLAAMRQLQDIGVTGELRPGERRTLRVKEKQVVGFELTARGLSPEHSLRLLEAGIGGRRRMGCGVFTPLRTSARS